VGPKFLTLAFKYAHDADPDAKLYYNDYNIEAGPKHESSMVLLRRLIKDGAPIHGVGIQGHWSTAILSVPLILAPDYKPQAGRRSSAPHLRLGIVVRVGSLQGRVGAVEHASIDASRYLLQLNAIVWAAHLDQFNRCHCDSLPHHNSRKLPSRGRFLKTYH
jgi:hypothetical protein